MLLISPCCLLPGTGHSHVVGAKWPQLQRSNARGRLVPVPPLSPDVTESRERVASLPPRGGAWEEAHPVQPSRVLRGSVPIPKVRGSVGGDLLVVGEGTRGQASPGAADPAGVEGSGMGLVGAISLCTETRGSKRAKRGSTGRCQRRLRSGGGAGPDQSEGFGPTSIIAPLLSSSGTQCPEAP